MPKKICELTVIENTIFCSCHRPGILVTQQQFLHARIPCSNGSGQSGPYFHVFYISTTTVRPKVVRKSYNVHIGKIVLSCCFYAPEKISYLRPSGIHFQAITLLFMVEFRYCLVQLIVLTRHVALKILFAAFKVKVIRRT